MTSKFLTREQAIREAEENIVELPPLTPEELARLDREAEEAIRTGRTPLLDALLPEVDWDDEERLPDVFFVLDEVDDYYGAN
jgi:hypothetical protein